MATLSEDSALPSDELKASGMREYCERLQTLLGSPSLPPPWLSPQSIRWTPALWPPGGQALSSLRSDLAALLIGGSSHTCVSVSGGLTSPQALRRHKEPHCVNPGRTEQKALFRLQPLTVAGRLWLQAGWRGRVLLAGHPGPDDPDLVLPR